MFVLRHPPEAAPNRHPEICSPAFGRGSNVAYTLGVRSTQDDKHVNNLLIILLPSFQGGRQTERLTLGGSLSPSFFALTGA